jgi:hypothetical protein
MGIHDLADQGFIGLKVNGLKVGRAPDELAGIAAGLFEKDRNRAADERGVEFRLLGMDQRLKLLQPGGFDLLRHLGLEV